MSKNTKPLNQVFGKKSVMSTQPDSAWPSPSELIGIEIEVENPSSTSVLSSSPYWQCHQDQSLRNGIEFVFRGPLGGRQLTEALREFFMSGITYDCTPRTSIHIHINASDSMGVDDLRALLLIMYVIEPAVFRWADDNRKYCGYCNPLTDLNPERLLGALFESGNDVDLVRAVHTGSNSDRYYGFNMAAMARHGTLEFRYFPCVKDEAVVKDWIKFVMLAKLAAVETTDVRLLLKQLQDPDTLREFLSTKVAEVGTQLDRHMDYEDAVGRARQLVAAMRTSPALLKSVSIRRDTARSRGFRNFLSTSYPELNASEASQPVAVSEAERALMEQIDMYQAAADRYRDHGIHSLAHTAAHRAEGAIEQLRSIARRSAEEQGITLSQYVAATNFNSING